MSKQEKIARCIRAITIPPVLIILTLIVLYHKSPAMFHGARDFWMSLLWLGICPVLAYPLQRILPGWKEKGREGQRNLAFICSVIGYLIAVVYGLVTDASLELQLIFNTYILSVVLLVFLNKVVKRRASGHACSITGPLIFLVYFVSWKMAAFGVLIGGMSFWASLKLKRHSLMDLLSGSMTCIVSFAIVLVMMKFSCNL
ncbi:MAG: hypothetical protein QM793_04140 [Muricomes sp.]